MISLSQILRRLRSSVVRYDQDFFNDQWFINWDQLKHTLKTLLAPYTRWHRILDFGCGPGIMIDYMNDCGYEYFGYDNSAEARLLYMNRFGRFPQQYCSDLPSGSEFDLFLSFDVFEHLTDESITQLIDYYQEIPWFLLNISRMKGIPGHINLKSDQDWILFFAERHLQFMAEETMKIRHAYLALKPEAPDLWHQNLFLLKSATAHGSPCQS
jgi:SAM-dependent methyltransferase